MQTGWLSNVAAPTASAALQSGDVAAPAASAALQSGDVATPTASAALQSGDVAAPTAGAAVSEESDGSLWSNRSNLLIRRAGKNGDGLKNGDGKEVEHDI